MFLEKPEVPGIYQPVCMDISKGAPEEICPKGYIHPDCEYALGEKN
jgi:hypothetical protein